MQEHHEAATRMVQIWQVNAVRTDVSCCCIVRFLPTRNCFQPIRLFSKHREYCVVFVSKSACESELMRTKYHLLSEYKGEESQNEMLHIGRIRGRILINALLKTFAILSRREPPFLRSCTMAVNPSQKSE